MKIELNDQQVTDILEALELAAEDQEQYEKHGCPEDDFDGDEEGLKKLRERPARWSAIASYLMERQCSNWKAEGVRNGE